MKRIAIIVSDGFCALAAFAVLWVAVTGGGVYSVFGIEIRAHSVGTSLLFLSAIILARLLAFPNVPLLNRRNWTPVDLGQRLSTWLVEVLASLKNLDRKSATTFVLVCLCFAFLLRAAIAWWNMGFYSGDDVELLQFVLSKLTGHEYRVWELRNPFYPMVFLYPAVYVAGSLGIKDPRYLVFVARLVVVLSSVAGVWASYRIGRALLRWECAGVVVAVIVALSGLPTWFSASVLPRAVAGTLILFAMLLLLGKRPQRMEFFAGALLGVAAALRFSEIIAVIAAIIVLLLERRATSAIRVAAAAMATTALALGLSDWIFRGDPLFSTKAIVEYTLLAGRSSRGTQPFWEYLPLLISGVGLLALFFAGRAWKLKHIRHLFWWVAVPVLLLSTLPHKEIRYLVPYVPALMVFAGIGLCCMADDVRRAPYPLRSHLALGLAVLIPAMFVHQVSLMQTRRSIDAVASARYVAAQMDKGVVAFEQSWRAGGWIFLPPATKLRDIDTRKIADASQILKYARNPAVRFIGLRHDHAIKYGYPSLLASHGFSLVQLSSKTPEYLLFEKTSSTKR